LEDIKDNPLSKIVFFEDDEIEAWVVINIFKQLRFEYGMSSKPMGYHYEALKDSIKWIGLRPKDYVGLIHQMFINYVNNLPE
jgi:hypothetical protein